MAKKKQANIESLADLKPDLRNANLGTERGRGMLERSLQETGAGRSILVDKNGKVIAGNKTLEAWGGLAEEANVEVVHTDGHKLVVVQRDDLDLDDPKGLARKLAYYDNRVGQIDLEWNAEELLQDIGAGLDLSGMWTEDEMQSLLANVQPPNFGPVGIEEQGKLDELADKSVECPECGCRFTP